MTIYKYSVAMVDTALTALFGAQPKVRIQLRASSS